MNQYIQPSSDECEQHNGCEHEALFLQATGKLENHFHRLNAGNCTFVSAIIMRLYKCHSDGWVIINTCRNGFTLRANMEKQNPLIHCTDTDT